jgi:hypothetical protein
MYFLSALKKIKVGSELSFSSFSSFSRLVLLGITILLTAFKDRSKEMGLSK